MRLWDKHYEDDLAATADEKVEHGELKGLVAWFDDVKAPQKILSFLVSEEFPLAPYHYVSDSAECPSILDLGTGNGQTLFQLRIQGRFRGPMVGVDYSEASIQLAQKLSKDHEGCQDITFAVMDIIKDEPCEQGWWFEAGFDLVLDKGTFDAISLSEETFEPSTSHHLPTGQVTARAHTLYPSRALSMVKPGGFLLVTSCNWTQEELIHWFTNNETGTRHDISVWKTIEYSKFRFGGHEGQAVCTVCFRKDLANGEV